MAQNIVPNVSQIGPLQTYAYYTKSEYLVLGRMKATLEQHRVSQHLVWALRLM